MGKSGKTQKPLEVWVAVVNHRQGHNVYTGRSRKSLDRQLYQYVKENWNGVPNLANIPRSHKKAIDLYFGYEHLHLEYVDIELSEVA